MVKLTLSRSDTLRENYRIPDAEPEAVDLGPFEYVELTYQFLRTSPDGDFVGVYKEGAWWLDGNGHPFSDCAISAA